MVLDNDPQQLNPQTATTAYKQPTEHQVLVVIDTNFFIDHLPLISKLADLAGINGVLIVVPWVVIQELDGLKMSSKSSGSQEWLDSSDSVGAVARSSSRFLESVLEQNNSPFVFQKRSEYLQYEEVNDDKILDCCLYFCKEFGLPVVVLTKDRNLSIKVRVNGCAVCSEASTRAEDFVLNIKAAALKAHSYQTQESKRSAVRTPADDPGSAKTEEYSSGPSVTIPLSSRIIAKPRFLKKSGTLSQTLPTPQRYQTTALTQPDSHINDDGNSHSDIKDESGAKRISLGSDALVKSKSAAASKHTNSQMLRAHTKSDRLRRRSSNIKGAGVLSPYIKETKAYNWDGFPFTFSVPSSIPEVDSAVSVWDAGNSGRTMPRELANVNGTETADMPESDSMDVDFVDDARHAGTHSNPTSNVPRSAVAGTSSVAATTYISGTAVVSRNLRNPTPQTDIAKTSLKRSITPEPTDQPVVIYLDESPLKARLARQSIAQRTATSVSEDIVRYMCDTKYCALTSLLVERLEQKNTILKSLGSITTGFDPPPWRTSTVLFTVILYHWDVLKQVLPRGIETNIRQSLPWIMYVEELQSCPQLKRPLPPNLRIAPFARTSHSSQTSEDPDLVSETKLLIQLAKRLLAQCALVENDVQERQRQKLVSSWVTWQNSKD